MSERYPGGRINQTAPVPSGPYASSAASGVWTLDQQAYWKQQGVWPIPGNLPNYIEDVFSTYLYTGNDTTQIIQNGLQLGGSYTSGGTGGSCSFNGTTGYLSVPTGSALNLPGDFTIEAYVYLTTYDNLPSIFSNGEYPTSGQVVFTAISGYPAVYMANGSAWGFNITSITQIPLSTWTHVALTCSGSTFTIWMNGVSVVTGTYSGTRVTPAATSVIGRLYPSTDAYYWAGNISNFRIVKGTALYTSNFTVSSSALTAVSGTQLLCLQGTTPFVDNSTNALTITVNGGTTANTSGPFPYTYTAGKGGLVWLKCRTTAYWNNLTDTARGAGYNLWSNDTAASTAVANGLTSFNGNGFTLGGYGNTNGSAGGNYVSWSFAEQAKFFDIVTFSGTSSTTATVNHNLGSVPGMIFVKVSTSAGDDWYVYHRSIPSLVLALNTSNSSSSPPASPQYAFGNGTTVVAPTSTQFTFYPRNAGTQTYVAYLFAHDAGGFGTSGTDNVITCGSYTGNGSATGPIVNLGYEPQYILIKGNISGGNWLVFDNMRGIPTGGSDPYLLPNSAAAEATGLGNALDLNATGFQITNTSGQVNNSGTTYIYMAIRRPMAVPTVGTNVFNPVAYTGNNTTNTTRGNITTDLVITSNTNNVAPQGAYNQTFWDRLRGEDVSLTSSNTNAQVTGWADTYFNLDQQVGWSNGSNTSYLNNSAMNYVTYNLKRASGFFDEVCYTGTGSATTQAHNLGVAPELIIVKSRSSNPGANWVVWNQTLNSSTGYLYLNSDMAAANFAGVWNGAPTSTYFTLGTNYQNNGSGVTFVAYLFATCPGVSKVGSYTGNGVDGRVINCGFTGGARFVLIKNTSGAFGGNWFVWDTARGMVSGTDPSLTLNTTAAEVNSNNVFTTTTGFIVNYNGLASINENGENYIFLAIA